MMVPLDILYVLINRGIPLYKKRTYKKVPYAGWGGPAYPKLLISLPKAYPNLLPILPKFRLRGLKLN